MARGKRKSRRRAIGFLLFAALTLLAAGFIAEREIPNLMLHSGALPAPQQTAGELNRERPRAANDSAADRENQSGEHISGSDRRQLSNLIRHKSR